MAIISISSLLSGTAQAEKRKDGEGSTSNNSHYNYINIDQMKISTALSDMRSDYTNMYLKHSK